MELNGAPVNPGAKPPTRSLDILRVLAISKDHACSLQDIYEWLWPDAEGDQAKAACEQALHRLRKLLSAPHLIVQRAKPNHLPPFVRWSAPSCAEPQAKRKPRWQTILHRLLQSEAVN